MSTDDRAKTATPQASWAMGNPPVPVTVIREETAAVATWDGNLVGVAFFELDPEEVPIPKEFRAFQADEPPSEQQVAEWLHAWTAPQGNGFNITGVRDLPLGVFEATLLRIRNQRRQSEPLRALTPEQINELVDSNERLWFRSKRDLNSALLQLLATQAYVEAVNSGDHFPTRAVKTATKTDERRAGQLVTLARRSKLLSESPAVGKPGGLPTEAAHHLARQAHQALGRIQAQAEEADDLALAEHGFSADIRQAMKENDK